MLPNARSPCSLPGKSPRPHRCSAYCLLLGYASVLIVETHDVVLAQIRPRLHLDHFERRFAGVFEPVLGTEGNERGLVFAHQEGLFPTGDERRAAHDDPVFRTMMVHLQGEPRTRFHNNTLYLKTLTMIDGVIETPRPLNLTMILRLGAFGGFQAPDHRLHFLHTILRCHQDRIGGFHDHYTRYSDARHQPAVGMRETVCRPFEDHTAASNVAVIVL